MANFIQRICSKVQKPERWLLLVYLVFAAYLIVDGFVYLLGPYSGRISVLDCTNQIEQRTICTVTLYGMRKTDQIRFWAEDFRNASKVANFDIGDSYKATYGVAIMITTDRIERIDFVAPYQSSARAQKATDHINQMFSKSETFFSERITYIGFDTSLYRRAILLVVGLLFILTYRSHWQAFINGEAVPRIVRNVIEKGNFRDFAFSWWRLNFLFQIIFLSLLFFISGSWSNSTQHGDFTGYSCNIVLRSCEICSKFPISSLLCLYPLIAYGTIQALFQWKLLNSEIKVSGLWVAAPAIASFALAPSLAFSACEHCLNIKMLLASVLPDMYYLLWGLIVYGLVVGFFQWIAMRRSLSSSISWILILPLNTVLILILRTFVVGYSFEQTRSIVPRILILLMWPLSLMINDIIPAKYISWLIYNKKSRQE